jgi:hypothetical protein
MNLMPVALVFILSFSINCQTMKTNTLIKALMIMVFIALGAPSFAAETPVIPVTETPEAQVARLSKRLEEIKAMDHKGMTKAEKKALRVEVRQIKQEMAAVSGGVYISVGAIIIILLLLILLV